MTAAPPDLRAEEGPPLLHFFETERGAHVLAVEGSRVYDAPPGLREAWEEAGPAERRALLEKAGIGAARWVEDDPPEDMPIRSLSLAVAQSCNLACGYCYASGGDFGGQARAMDWETAKASVDRLIAEAEPGARLTLAFLGGEPLVNRPVLRRATGYAAGRAAALGAKIGFAITTNGTLLTPEDARFLADHGFAVTVSMDGVGETHDRLRPYRGGRGSFAAIRDRLGPLIALQDRMRVSARVTVTPRNLDLAESLDGLIALGFDSVGFAPMLSAPTGRHELDAADLARMLEEMIACGRVWERETLAGRRYPFSNMESAMAEIHRGTHRPYPCGAGAGYFGVSASGGLYACHRFVEDEGARLGDLAGGLDLPRRRDWLAERHVSRQSPCTRCWARQLCGGGCHHEVLRRGRVACDYVRGWLDHCLGAYVRVTDARPDLFRRPAA